MSYWSGIKAIEDPMRLVREAQARGDAVQLVSGEDDGLVCVGWYIPSLYQFVIEGTASMQHREGTSEDANPRS